ncbi:hypothetical protein CFC21_021357 [Triticum aestivum]|uniref:DUF4220 domain-containing protein n=2 Tax=Triticum aestivum TaxID=4565 RepID=A0A9R1J6R0_WHEAT|nr:hypothetical protein CFC21_021357 [Triticum aestivum]
MPPQRSLAAGDPTRKLSRIQGRFAVDLLLLVQSSQSIYKAPFLQRVLLPPLLYMVNNISACDDTMSQRQQLLAFWATFLLHNLGGPDNMSALSLEDSSLYRREAPLVLSRVGGAIYFLYKHLHTGSGGGALITASIMVLVVGATKYAERACALWQALDYGSLIRKGMDGKLDDEEALIVAHGMLRFCKRAMADSSVYTEPPDKGAMVDSSADTESPDNDYDLDTSRKILDMKWGNMCSVVEMELSLMYDILYTKASIIHTSTGVGYIICIASPLAIVAATVLFGFYYNKEGQSLPDVMITYTLLLATLLLDTRWLLSALGSIWTHAFLQASRPCRWLRHAVLCSGRWLQLRHFVVSLDVRRLRLTGSPRSASSYRRWSGTIGKYSLLQECTRKISVCGKAAKVIGLGDIWKEYQHSRGGRKLSDDVKEAAFTRVREVLRLTYEKYKDGIYSMRDITTSWGQVTKEIYTKKNVLKAEQKEVMLGFGREFQEDILVWHIATKIFLVHAKKKGTLADAIVALSEHLMFLMAVNPDMLPGLALRSLYETTLKYLQGVLVNANISPSRTTGEEKLARILYKNKDGQWDFDGKKIRGLLKEGANIAMVLLNEADNSNMQELLELVFNIWVDKLLYAGTRCNRESHAKQLGHGGDLTTIVWLMAEHAGPFRTGELGSDVGSDEGKPEDRKEG